MTAIAIAQLPGGFVVAADGRMQMDPEARMKASTTELARETEYAQKIFEISDSDKAIASAITGTIANDDFTFNFVEEAKDQTRLLANRKIDSFTQYANRFCSNLSRKTAKPSSLRKSMRLFSSLDTSKLYLYSYRLTFIFAATQLCLRQLTIPACAHSHQVQIE